TTMSGKTEINPAGSLTEIWNDHAFDISADGFAAINRGRSAGESAQVEAKIDGDSLKVFIPSSFDERNLAEIYDLSESIAESCGVNFIEYGGILPTVVERES